LREKH